VKRGPFKPLGIILAGMLLSAVLYPFTHGRRAPEMFGIAAGCLLVDGAIWLLWRDEDAMLKAFVAEALVGLGVAANRVRLTVLG